MVEGASIDGLLVQRTTHCTAASLEGVIRTISIVNLGGEEQWPG
jgi:hypothetical protein